ncbi:MAG TPA: hypothetical protein VFF65_13725, partial [Phycisphaerales bacterium]|nr:hypothetical protein [Phycisphaerales bacterium]
TADALVNAAGRRLAVLAVCAATAGAAHAQTVVVPLAPARAIKAAPAAAPAEAEQPPAEAPAADGQPVAPAPGAPAAPLTPEETADLKSQYEALSKDEQDQMKAYYKDLGLDLDQLLGYATAASAEATRTRETVAALREMDFARTPQNVLTARSKLGFGQMPIPNVATAKGADIARWLHLQVMAGEWGALSGYLAERSKPEAQQVYSQILQSLNRGNSGLLPEEVLAFANACPEEPKPWQLTALAAMLRTAAEKNSPGPMLAEVKAGTKLFGPADAGTRRRTVDLLAGAGLVQQAYDYLPPLDEARSAGDGELVLVHGRYRADLAAKEGPGPEGEAHRAGAWDLFTEVSLMERASQASRQEAIKQAVGLMTRMPRAQVTPWLRSVFANDTLGPAALQAIALTAAGIGDAKQDEEQRAQAILSLKESVDVLLERRDIDQSVLRVPMRMLTAALVTEMENAVNAKGRQRTIAKEAQLLLRAVPSKAWFDALEPSLAVRAGRACIGIATIADETDLALSLLADAVARTPDQAVPIADSFLKTWEMRLAPKSDIDQDAMIYYFWREAIAQAPLTRGRQRRNLERLGRLIDTLRTAGVDARTLPALAPAFKACHGITEVYDVADITRVFGPIPEIPPATCAALASTMAASLNGDWRNRATQTQQGVKRTDTEIAQLVDKGYGIALELIDSALSRRPDSWRFAVVKAGLAYDRLQFRIAQKKGGDSAKQAELKAQAFAAFEQAAARYAASVAAGEEREDIGVYERWFGAAMGTSQLNFIAVDDLPTESGPGDAPRDDQVERVRKAIAALPPDAAFRHVSDFARVIGSAVSRAEPEVKPRLVKQALRVIGDHPAGASLRSLEELYRDLVKDEIKLRMVIDGDDRVGTGRQFGVMLSLRFTNSVDRETGGFAKYLQTNAFVRVGRQYQEVNFREKLQKGIEASLGKGFNVESIGFFDPFMPPRGVTESGQDGWLEKPMAYAVVSRKDPAADRLPQVTMDMQFEDQTGPVTLVLPSNTPPIAVGAAAVADSPLQRPVSDLKVTMVVDPRDARDGEKDRAIKLEVVSRGKGAVPDLRDTVSGIENAIEGYTVDAKSGIEAKPTVVMQEGEASTSRFGWGQPKAPEGGYPEPDENGIYRLTVERSWIVTYTPTGSSQGSVFTLPKLKEGIAAKVESRSFSDMDLVPVQGGVVRVEGRNFWVTAAMIGVPLIVVAAGIFAWRRARSAGAPAADTGFPIPEHVTPLNAVMTLRRLHVDKADMLDAGRRAELERDIAAIELKYFGPAQGPA